MRTCVCGHAESEHSNRGERGWVGTPCWADDPNGPHGLCTCMEFIEQPSNAEVREAEAEAGSAFIALLDKIINGLSQDELQVLWVEADENPNLGNYIIQRINERAQREAGK